VYLTPRSGVGGRSDLCPMFFPDLVADQLKVAGAGTSGLVAGAKEISDDGQNTTEFPSKVGGGVARRWGPLQ